MFDEMNKKLEHAGLIAVVQLENADCAVPLAEALYKGGMRALEITFRSEGLYGEAEKAIKAVRAEVPQMLCGGATIINKDLAERAEKAGAQFIVSAGFNSETVDWCIKKNLPVYPGVCTPTEIEAAVGKGLTTLKFFPAEAGGGVEALKALGGPFPQVKFLASGGLNADNCSSYFACPNVAAVSGSWMVKGSLIQSHSWNEIQRLAHEAVLLSLGFEFAHMGINYSDEKTCAADAALLDSFGFKSTENPQSWFCGKGFELMKNGGPGHNGHAGILTWNIERALDYLAQFGIKPVMDTAKWLGAPEKSPLFFVYTDKEIGGFAVHLKRK